MNQYGPPQPPPYGYGPPPQPPYGYGAPPPMGPMGPQGPAPRVNALAVASMVTGILALVCGIGSWVCCFLVVVAAPLAFLFSAVSIPTGGVAMSQIKKSNGALGGNGMAIAGLICGIVALIPTILWVIIIGFSAATSP